MNSLFFRDILNNQSVSYLQLYNDVVNATGYNRHIKTSDYYSVFLNIVLSIILGKEIILLDDDFSSEEVKRLTGVDDFSQFSEDISGYPICNLDIDEFITALKNPSENWRLTLFTSGTTGLPKKISHSFQTITRSVRSGEKYVNNVWGFAYNPTHMAGIQVFFQALVNLNPIIRLFKCSKDEIFNEIYLNKITHISATPTFYRLLLPYNKSFDCVQNVTSGGEKFDQHTSLQLRSIFPSAKFTNVYASTEAGSLFATENDIFHIKNQFSGLVIVKENELLIHKSLLGYSEGVEYFENQWYATGDLVEVITITPLSFKFINRKNEMINVGGYKVNPIEVEEVLRTIDGIIEAFVYAKSNSVLGNIIIAEIITNDASLNEQKIREQLNDKIQEFKIPRIIKFVDKINTTRTGKIQRKQ